LLDLSGEKQGDCAVVVLIIGIMMDEFVQAWADDQDRSPLEHGSQKQRDHLRTDGGGILSNARLFGFSFSVHETLERLASREDMRPKKNLEGFAQFLQANCNNIIAGRRTYTLIRPLPTGQGSFMKMAGSQ
jgi:hypothetical protein